MRRGVGQRAGEGLKFERRPREGRLIVMKVAGRRWIAAVRDEIVGRVAFDGEVRLFATGAALLLIIVK